MSSMAFKNGDLASGDVVVYAVHDHTAPSATEWQGYLDLVAVALRKAGDPARVVGFVATDGGAPNAVQRQALAALLQREEKGTARIRSAVVSESAIVKAVVTTLSWLLPSIRVFSPAAARDALKFIGVGPGDVDSARQDIGELARAVPRARTVHAVLAALDAGTGRGSASAGGNAR